MCGRYHFSFDLMDEVAGLAEGAKWRLELGLMDKDIHPGDTAPVIAAGADDGKLQIRRQGWGLPAPGGKGLVFNARSESVTEKPMFREGIGRRRAAIPVSWFYEWNKCKEKYSFARGGAGVLFLAGFSTVYEDGEHFVILTTEANPSVAPVHSRMPLVLEKEQVRDWILHSSSTGELLAQVPGELSKSCEYEQQTLF